MNERFDTFVAERLRVTGIHAMPHSQLLHLSDKRLSTYIDHAIQATILQVQAGLHAMVKERIVVKEKWPATWQDAVKDRWFPAWAIRRWPVAYRTIDIDQKIYGPICTHQLSEPARTHLQWMMAKV